MIKSGHRPLGGNTSQRIVKLAPPPKGPPVGSAVGRGHTGRRGGVSLSFPAGKHDDQVDVLGLIGQLLGRISAKPKLDFSIVTKREAYRPAFEGTSNFNWTPP